MEHEYSPWSFARRQNIQHINNKAYKAIFESTTGTDFDLFNIKNLPQIADLKAQFRSKDINEFVLKP